jgi:hypothetical protein
MIKSFKSLFIRSKEKSASDYAGFSDFFLRASAEMKRKVITEAAQKSNEDQMNIFKKAYVKTK